jgi:hypothetical protein
MKKIILYLALAATAAVFIGFQMKSPQGENNNQHFQSVEQHFRRARRMAYVYPEAGKFASEYKRFIDNLGARNRYFRIYGVPVSLADSIANDTPLCLLGSPASNSLLAKLLPSLPISFAANSFTINQSTFSQSGDVAILTLPYPGTASRPLTIITGNDDRAIFAYLNRQDRRIRPTGDYSIFRDGKIIAYGFFAPGNGAVKVEREVNFLRERNRVYRDEYFVVDFSGQKFDEAALRAFLAEQRKLVQQQMHQIDFPDNQKSKVLPIHLVLYETAERKTIATRNSRFSSWQPGEEEIHLVFHEALRGDDFTAIAEYICWQWAGEIPNESIRTAAGILFSNDWGREGYPVWAGRLFFNDFFIPFEELFTNDHNSGVSDYITGPELATFLQFILFHDGAKSLKTLLRNTPAALDPAEIDKRFPPRLQESWQGWCENMLQNTPLGTISQSKAFQKGFCYAHEGYAIYNGYMGSTSEIALNRLAELGVNSISMTPFGFPRSMSEPAPIRKSNGIGSENDESLIVSAHFARRHGMRIMLKPHLWAGRFWPGDIKMADEQDWPLFFENYEKWMTHYALLAQMCQFESLVVGLELVQASVGHEDEWRKMIAKIRKIYSGKLIYAANWGQEFENLTFWDALDAIGVNSYYPLSKNPDARHEDLVKGARKIARRIEQVAEQYDKPVVLTEIGFASRPNTWIDPHVDGRGQQPDVEAQERCYEVIFQVFYHQPWLQGIYWWKWPTHLADGGLRDSGFTPNRKAAEKVIARWYRK